MSGKWTDFDPLARSRAKPAAPVMSLEQAEVRPTKPKSSPYLSEPNSPTATEPKASKDISDIEASKQGSTASKEVEGEELQSPIAEDPIEVGTMPKDAQQLRDAHFNPSPQEITGNSGNEENEKLSEDNEKQNRSASPEIIAQSVDKTTSKSPAQSRAELDTITNPESKTQIPTNPKSNDEGLENVVKGGSEDENVSKAVAKLGFDDTDGEPHHGDLRKNSIAAMKELGSPSAKKTSVTSPEEDLPFDFQRFMGLLRSRSADPIARYVKSFLQEFSRGVWNPTQQEKIVADFQKFIGVKMREFEPFASLSKRDRRNSSEGMEKLIMNWLYTRTFPPKMPPILRCDGHNEDLLRDQVFEEKLRLWSWVEGRHLDINEGYLLSGFIQLAAKELMRLHQFKSPRDKTICVLNCSKVVWALIRQAQLEQNADSFLPLLIYVVIKAQPVHLVSNINYIQRFRSKEFLKGETAYYLSTLASAVTFLDTLDKSSLTISDEEFNQKMEESIRIENQRKAQLQKQQEERPQHQEHNVTDQASLEGHEGESSAAVLAQSAGMLVERMRSFTSKFIEDLSTPEETDTEGHAQGSSSQSQDAELSRARRTRNQHREEERAVREASREEFRAEQLQRTQFDETSATLQQMFPGLDKEVVEDVLRQCGANIGSAVDLCLALVGTS